MAVLQGRAEARRQLILSDVPVTEKPKSYLELRALAESKELRAGDLELIEEAIKSEPWEKAAVFHQNGNLIGFAEGGPTSVHIPADFGLRARGGVLTHNHPSGSPMSRADFSFFWTREIKEMRAIGVQENGRTMLYRFRFTDEILEQLEEDRLEDSARYWQYKMQFDDEVQAALKKEIDGRKEWMAEMLATGQLSRRQATDMVYHRAWTKLQDDGLLARWGITYEKIDVAHARELAQAANRIDELLAKEAARQAAIAAREQEVLAAALAKAEKNLPLSKLSQADHERVQAVMREAIKKAIGERARLGAALRRAAEQKAIAAARRSPAVKQLLKPKGPSAQELHQQVIASMSSGQKPLSFVKLGGSYNPVQRLEMKNAFTGERFQAYWKPAKTDKHTDDNFKLAGGDQATREVFAYEFSQLLGIDLVPPTTRLKYQGEKPPLVPIRRRNGHKNQMVRWSSER
jgi:hypothetical protein